MQKFLSLWCAGGAVAVVLLCFVPSSLAQDCSDRHPSCPLWAERGECYKNPGYMWAHCAESCHQCTVQDDNCQDVDLQCPAWANNGECQRNYVYMRKTCARSCTFCMPANNHNVPYVHSNVVDDLWKNFTKVFPNLQRNHLHDLTNAIN